MSVYEMKLHNEPFLKIKSGRKSIEMRLFDERRRGIATGDTIVFENRRNSEKLTVRVKALKVFKSFEDLYGFYPKEMLGYENSEDAFPSDMEIYYTKEQIEKYGTLAIEIEVIEKNEEDKMEKIASFTIDHTILFPGLYVSRKDERNGITVTTFDMRMTAPNREPAMDVPAIHTIEHLGATYLRNCNIKSDIVYFGPMGCRTGFYILVFGDKTSEEMYETVLSMCDFILSFEGEIPGAKPEECGNYSEQSLPMAKYYIGRYKKALIENKLFVYPTKESE